MPDPTPATPPAGATPGTPPPAGSVPASTPDVPPGAPQPEATVTIPLKELSRLQREAARKASVDRRLAIYEKRGAPAPAGEGEDEANRLIIEANQRADAAEKKAMQSEVRGKVRDLFDKEEFKNIPASTRDLILKNPSALSSAESLDEAILDIEDYLRENVIPSTPAAKVDTAPAGHQTPPVSGGGSPAAITPDQLEDVSKLTGSAKTQAMVRNNLRSVMGQPQN